ARSAVHRAPSQWQRMPPPTAHTSFEASAVTPARPLPQPLEILRQATPSQCSVTARKVEMSTYCPTAQTSFAATAATASRLLAASASPEFGLGTRVQAA